MQKMIKRAVKLFNILKSPYTFKALTRGIAAAVEHENFLATTQSQCVVDIGANRGQFTLACRKSLPNATIYSFEPLREPASLFRNFFHNDPRVKLFECAIGPEKRPTTIHVSKEDDSSSLLSFTSQVEIFPGTEEKETRTIEMYPLDALIGVDEILSPALLKIDVQGYELQVLHGCESLLDRFEIIYVECSFIELYAGQALAYQVIAYLQKRGFYLSGIYNLHYNSNQAIQGDFLFTKLQVNDAPALN